MPFERADQQHLGSAHGYIELGMFKEANAELEEIDPFCRSAPEVLITRVIIYQALKKWDLMAIVAKKLVEWNPSEPGHFIDLAYATRRAESVRMAHAILTRGAGLHPNDGNDSVQPRLLRGAAGQHRPSEGALDPRDKNRR